MANQSGLWITSHARKKPPLNFIQWSTPPSPHQPIKKCFNLLLKFEVGILMMQLRRQREWRRVKPSSLGSTKEWGVSKSFYFGSASEWAIPALALDNFILPAAVKTFSIANVTKPARPLFADFVETRLPLLLALFSSGQVNNMMQVAESPSLLTWRNKHCQRHNRPRGWVLQLNQWLKLPVCSVLVW